MQLPKVSNRPSGYGRGIPRAGTVMLFDHSDSGALSVLSENDQRQSDSQKGNCDGKNRHK
jgi:hypothetical protein